MWRLTNWPQFGATLQGPCVYNVPDYLASQHNSSCWVMTLCCCTGEKKACDIWGLQRGLCVLVSCLAEPRFNDDLYTSPARCLYTCSRQAIGLRRGTVFYFLHRSSTAAGAESRGFVITVLSLPLHFSVCVFCLYWSWQPLRGGRALNLRASLATRG